MRDAVSRPSPSVAARVAEVRGAHRRRPRARAGRDPAAVTLVAATKTVEPSRVQEVVDAGVLDVGENRAQELLAKTAVTGPPPVGAAGTSSARLQRNKVRALAPWVACWQSVDRRRARRRDRPAGAGRPGARRGEPRRRSRRRAAAARRGARAWSTTLRADGPRRRRPHGRAAPRRRPPPLVRRAAGARRPALALPELSMGMTDDFEVAVEEGATMVRVGRALFGPRPGHP